jgi:spore maturation protein CgeB
VRILVTGENHFNHVFSVVKSCKQLGHEVKFINMVDFFSQCNYIQKKLNKLGIKSLEDNYNNIWNKNFIDTCKHFKPDIVLAINGAMFESFTLEWLRSLKISLILWLFDGRRRLAKHENKMNYYDKIYCFEEYDIPYFQEKYNLNVQYCPVGFESDIYTPDDTISRDIDISFIGSSSQNRVETLQSVAKYVCQKSLNMQIYGKWWNEKYFWKKHLFEKKYSPLVKYINNFELPASKAADIYRRSKICLNINVSEHLAINPRTFEILGTKSFQLMDTKENTDIIEPGIDLITYNNVDNLLSKIDYYLENEKERNQIAKNGYNKVKDKFTMIQMVKTILE